MSQVLSLLLTLSFLSLIPFQTARAQQSPSGDQAPINPEPTEKSAANKKQPSTGDIDMNQFQNLKKVDKTKANPRIPTQVNCTDTRGVVIRKGDPGFDNCLVQSQSPVLSEPARTEIPNDPRKQ